MSGRKEMKQYPAVIKEEVRKQIAAGRSQNEISREYGISRYRNLTKEYGITPSMSRRGNRFDNAMVENFFSILKTECIYRHKPKAFAEAPMIDRYIHFYNYQRIQLKTGVAPLTLRHSA